MIGTVLALEGDRVSVRPSNCGGCFGCMKKSCTAGRLITAKNPKGLPLVPGQKVEIQSPPAPLLFQTLTSLLPPLAGFIAGFWLGGLFSMIESSRALAGMLGFFAVGTLVYLVRRRFPPRAFPVIKNPQDM